MKKENLLLLFLFVLLISGQTYAQNVIHFYHGKNDESISLDDDGKEFGLVDNIKIVKASGDGIMIMVDNPNPIFYDYTFKTEVVNIEESYPNITPFLETVTKLLPNDATEGITEDASYQAYKNTIENLGKDINEARALIIASDLPESKSDAFLHTNTDGLRGAIKKIRGIRGGFGEFNSTTLANDLNSLYEKFKGDLSDDTHRAAFLALNADYVRRVNELQNLVLGKNLKTLIKHYFVVGDKPTKITLTIKPKDVSNLKLNLSRETREFVIATLIPEYDRATVELIPVANFAFSKDVNEYYLEDNIVKRELKDKIVLNPGLLLNINFAKFGEFKEMAVGMGLGYSFSKQSTFNHFSLSSLFSYRNFLRVGAGVGFSQFPSGLNNGGKLNSPLPSDISDLNEVVGYDNKLTGFITFSFTGLDIKLK